MRDDKPQTELDAFERLDLAARQFGQTFAQAIYLPQIVAWLAARLDRLSRR